MKRAKKIFAYFFTFLAGRETTGVFSTPSTQLAFTCSKSTIETPEKGVKYVQRWQ